MISCDLDSRVKLCASQCEHCDEARGLTHARNMQAEPGPSKQGGMGLTYLFLIEFDRDHDNKVSIEEWNDGFQGQAEDEQDRKGVGDSIAER